MCVGIPVKIIRPGEFVALCEGRNGEEEVNMMLIGPQVEGTWVLNFLGSAREVLSEQEALQIDKALDGLSAIMSGQDIEVKDYFPDLEQR